MADTKAPAVNGHTRIGNPAGLHLPTAPAWGTPPAPVPAGDGEEFTGLQAGDLIGEDAAAGPVDRHLITVKPEGKSRFAVLDGDDPIAPAWLTDPAVLRDKLARQRHRARRAAVWALVNGFWLTACAVVWFLRGTVKAGRSLTRWLLDSHGHPALGVQPASTDKAYTIMADRWSFRVRARLTVAGVLLGALAVAGLVLWLVAAWAVVLLGALAVVLATRHGKPAEVKVFSPGIRAHTLPRITTELVARALAEVVDGETRKAIREHSDRLWQSGFRDAPGGHVVRIVLPGSAVAAALVPHEQRLASALGRPEDCVIVEPLPHITTGHADLHIFDTPRLGGKPQPGPLATAKRANWWGKVSVGQTRIGRQHHERIHGGAWFFGGKPESGKSSAGMIVAAHTALDPYALLLVVNLKGSPDYLPLKAACHRYISTTPELDPKVIAEVTALVRWLLEEAARRNEFFSRLVEQGKATGTAVTEELSRQHPELRPMTVILDEIHRMFDKSDNPEAEAFGELLGKVLKAVRSVAISVVGITQLAGTESIPGVVTRAARVRACLKVSESVSFRQIFGDAGQGVFASVGVARFPQGTALMSAEDGTPTKVGCWYITRALPAIGERAVALRQKMHTLTGEAAGEDPGTGTATDPAELLTHCLQGIAAAEPAGGPADADVAWVSSLEAALTEHPAYRDRAPGWLGTELKAREVPMVAQLNRRVPSEDGETRQRNERGVSARDVREALGRLLDT